MKKNKKKHDKRTATLIDIISRDDITVVFDVDGVLAPYEFGLRHHNIQVGEKDSDWNKYVLEERPYDRLRKIPQVARFIKEKGPKNVFVCSTGTPEERPNKEDFVHRNYKIPKKNIFFVDSSSEKTDVLRQISKIHNVPLGNIALVEDTVKTIDAARKELGCITIHISSFFFKAKHR